MKKILDKLGNKIRIYLSHHPRLYALVVGGAIVLFWRGIWHTTDLIHTYFNLFKNNLTIDSVHSPWWDGPLSLFVGIAVLLLTGAFTSSFIGNELILSGLKKEKKLSEKTESEIKGEEQYIQEIKEVIGVMSGKIAQLEREIEKKKK